MLEALGVFYIKGIDVLCVWQHLYYWSVWKAIFHSRLNLRSAQEPQIHGPTILPLRCDFLKCPFCRAEHHHNLDVGLLFESRSTVTEVVFVLENVQSYRALQLCFLFESRPLCGYFYSTTP